MDGPNERKGYPVTAAGYELLEEIGQGVSATVYRALCLPVNEVVAIKSLDLEKCISNLDGIRREAQMMSLINHPNVVKAYCSFVVDQALWVVMPYMAGGSCLHIMKAAYSDGFEEPVIATVLKAALKALEYLHRHGHIHRDVKAGNILVDASGAVKLGDFGVSACMFDTGDRQRSRNTFVGTPCWMAPEVMEQLHGYDFKADIWSFGITGLELAHGHAPFSKYPPMKVLLMTLQNAPPGLDYERDKRFSKLFKEMIAMCLVKDPAKRPSAEKLLKHSFFKHARNCEYVARHVLDGLPSLGDRVKTLKLNDAVRLAQKKMLSGEWEERSQNEYKRGVSSWNFNVEDLKTRAAMIQDDHGTVSAAAKEESEASQVCDLRGEYESSKASRVRADVEDATPAASDTLPANLLLSDSRGLESSRTPTPAVLPNVVEAVSSVRSSRIPRSDSLASSPSAKRPDADHLISRSASIGKRDHKHGGRTSTRGSEFDAGSSADAHAIGKQNSSDEWQSSGRRDVGVEREGRDEKGEGISGESESRQAVRVKENSNRTQFRERATVSASVPCIGCSDASDERLRVGIIQKKGRFSITSEGVERDPAVEKEREHLQQIADLQNKVARLLEELQAVKSKNAELERQLSRTSVGERIQSG